MIREPGDEEGSTLILTIFYCALALVLMLATATATSLYIERKRLFTLADGAAAVGAEAFDLDQVRADSGDLRPVITNGAVREAVRTYLRANADPDLGALNLQRAVSPDGRSASVTLSAEWSPPLLASVAPAGLRLEVTSVARSVFGD